ncbi:hypothetical protein B0J15DRAFT_477031 [Fusarium solani]|uniref:Uncharacterized protein n=1 Tax=Fusarium solani TaxID=169388 RepID=A0A9P9L3N4_FUSSL|nr:uncharacterized protein B0J15DRAFT_477031 [Fusarium solani]KAH7273386.1 hypothetical protein B0J15DRAFT_477031 [Fusarium solani]
MSLITMRMFLLGRTKLVSLLWSVHQNLHGNNITDTERIVGSDSLINEVAFGSRHIGRRVKPMNRRNVGEGSFRGDDPEEP